MKYSFFQAPVFGWIYVGGFQDMTVLRYHIGYRLMGQALFNDCNTILLARWIVE